MDNPFEHLQYNEVTTIKRLVENELRDYIQYFSNRKITLNEWYQENKDKLEAITTWQNTTSREMILGGIYHRCLKYEKNMRELFKNNSKQLKGDSLCHK